MPSSPSVVSRLLRFKAMAPRTWASAGRRTRAGCGAGPLALKDVHLALQAAGDGRLEVLACLAGEWQRAVDHGLGEQDLTVVTKTIEEPEGAL